MLIKLLLPLLFMMFQEETKAPDFQFFHEKGVEQSLSDYKGEVVYLSFWASWCRPCLGNFQKYNETRKELQEMGVVLLNVSMDKDKAAWEKALKSYSFLNGENVHVSDLRTVMNLYGISTIPSYRIMDRAQDFLYLGEGDDRDIVASFKTWLIEK